MPNIFIAGIDTDVGKTYVTGLIAKFLSFKGKSVITHKISQTGCTDISKDILTHREIMGSTLNKFDNDGTTCPYTFKYPASPHLSAELENVEIDIKKIENSIKKLEKEFEYVVIEGVGGIMVPLNKNFTSLDFIQKNNLSVILVSYPKLGSINHTLLSLEILKSKNIQLLGIVYNTFGNFEPEIENDSIKVFKRYLNKLSFPEMIIKIGNISNYNNTEISKLFNGLNL